MEDETRPVRRDLLTNDTPVRFDSHINTNVWLTFSPDSPVLLRSLAVCCRVNLFFVVLLQNGSLVSFSNDACSSSAASCQVTWSLLVFPAGAAPSHTDTLSGRVRKHANPCFLSTHTHTCAHTSKLSLHTHTHTHIQALHTNVPHTRRN